jgi:hypothetical protein
VRVPKIMLCANKLTHHTKMDANPRVKGYAVANQEEIDSSSVGKIRK